MYLFVCVCVRARARGGVPLARELGAFGFEIV